MPYHTDLVLTGGEVSSHETPNFEVCKRGGDDDGFEEDMYVIYRGSIMSTPPFSKGYSFSDSLGFAWPSETLLYCF